MNRRFAFILLAPLVLTGLLRADVPGPGPRPRPGPPLHLPIAEQNVAPSVPSFTLKIESLSEPGVARLEVPAKALRLVTPSRASASGWTPLAAGTAFAAAMLCASIGLFQLRPQVSYRFVALMLLPLCMLGVSCIDTQKQLLDTRHLPPLHQTSDHTLAGLTVLDPSSEEDVIRVRLPKDMVEKLALEVRKAHP